jgi:HAMP domain-containing protein
MRQAYVTRLTVGIVIVLVLACLVFAAAQN